MLKQKATARGKRAGTKLYALIYIALAKKGTVTNTKLTAVERAIADETGLPVELEAGVVRKLGAALVGIIDHNVARQIFSVMAQQMAGRSLRLSIIMMQAVKSGMTAYWAVAEANNRYQNFDWAEASRYIPSDFTNYLTAANAVGGDQYWGFKADIGTAKHTNYKSLTWLCMKLLIKCDGAEFASLTNYGSLGQPRAMEHLQNMVNNYVVAPTEQPVQGTADILNVVRNQVIGAAGGGNEQNQAA